MTSNHYNFNTLASEFLPRIEGLISRMTLEEKVGQLTQNHINNENYSEIEDRIQRGQVGSILTVYGIDEINSLQRIAVEIARLGIPLIIGNDVIHGYRTIF